MTNSQVRIALWAGVLVALSACGMAPGTATVSVTEVSEAPLEKTVVASGRVSSAVQVQIGALVGGRVAATPVNAGAEVKLGQLLLQLQDSAERAEVAQAEATLNLSRLQLQEAERQSRRQLEMARQGLISAAQADTEGNRAELARYQVELSLAALNAARARLSETLIRAPADGVLLRREVEVGDLVQAGTAVLGLAVKGPVQVRVDADERYLSLLGLGQPATVIADAYPAQPFTAVVTEVAPVVDRQRGTVEVKLLVDNAPSFLLNDMTVSAEIRVASIERALLLPVAAVHESDGQAWVWRLVEGHVQRQHVKTGLRGDGHVQISSGLVAGDLVVASAAELREGQSVRVAGGAD